MYVCAKNARIFFMATFEENASSEKRSVHVAIFKWNIISNKIKFHEI